MQSEKLLPIILTLLLVSAAGQVYFFVNLHNLKISDASSQAAFATPGTQGTIASTTNIVIPTARNCDSLGIPKSVKV
jgi:hypothetical protein